MEYLDFELEIGLGSGRDYPVAVVNSPGGEGSATMHFPFDELALESHLKDVQIALLRSGDQHRQILSTEERSVQDFGRALFEALFVGEVRSRYEVSQLAVSDQDKGLRVKLRIQPPELARLPWEFLYSSNEREYVCLSSNTPLVRYLELPRPPQPLTITPPLHILGMTASPHDLPGLDVGREKQRIERAIQGLQQQGAIELTWLQGQTAEDLQRAMRAGPWHVFHFIGHGDFDARLDEGLIALADDEGKADLLRATDLGRLLADHHALRLVVLNSCEGAHGSMRDLFSSTAAILVGRGIPAVLAMQYEITDRAAITLTRAFYMALADGMPVDAAVSEARKTMSIRGGVSVEWATPVLYMRSPNGVLFHLTRRQRQQQVKPEASVPEREASQTRPSEPVIDEHREVVSQVSHPLRAEAEEAPSLSTTSGTVAAATSAPTISKTKEQPAVSTGRPTQGPPTDRDILAREAVTSTSRASSLPAEMARPSTPPVIRPDAMIAAKPVKRSISKRIVLLGIVGLIVVALASGIAWLTRSNTSDGVITEFPLTAGSSPYGITAGPDGNLWFTEHNRDKIGRITPGGAITELPLTAGSSPYGITAWPDGNLWFTGVGKIGRITPGGTITEIPLTSGSSLYGITAGPDGGLWFTDHNRYKIGRITPGGAWPEFPLTAGSYPDGIAAGPDGNLWFTEGGKIGRISTGGTISEFPLPTAGSFPGGIAAGPDGNLWFTEGNKIGRISTGGAITEFPIPTANSHPYGITAGPDGNLWFTEADGNKIGRFSSGK